MKKTAFLFPGQGSQVVGMAEDLGVMIAAVVIAVAFMMLSAGKVSAFVSNHPTVKMLALSFLILIGVMLVV